MVESKKSKIEKKIENSKNIKNKSHIVEKKISKQFILYIGEYSSKIKICDTLLNKKDTFSNFLFLNKFYKEINEWSQSIINHKYILSLEKNVDSHFWYQILPIFNESNVLIEELKKKAIDTVKGAIILSSLWDGFGSALTPTLISKFKESNTNSIVFGI